MNVFEYPLFRALLERRSRRFARGLRLDGGPLSFESTLRAEPLTPDEEAALVFAACGITGWALAELPYERGTEDESGSGNIMAQLVGRTVPSPDALHDVVLFVLNDGGAWMIRRPQDFPRAELPALIAAARAGELTSLYEKSRVRIADVRPDVPRELPYVPPFNKWSANVPGTTYFLPVNELTALTINILLSAFNEEFGYFLLDDRAGFRPAGVGRFARSKGGWLHDDPARGRVVTLSFLEGWLYELAAVEHGAMIQNLGLMTQALGLGGFPHFAAHPFGWTRALGFRMEEQRLSRIIGSAPAVRALMKFAGKDALVPTAIGLERNGSVLLRPWCPPYFRSMEEAVLAFVDSKFAPGAGTMRDGGAASGWRDGAKVQTAIPQHSDGAIAATIACCEYVFRRYGRIPPGSGPFRTVLAHQAHHLDPGFYERFYRADVVSELPRPRD
ncbi:MAG: hypothetical protein ACT4PE_12995 [Candidatus Eiseniibacteriota bacterium]